MKSNNKTLNIVLLPMSMDIGGAETHVLTLAKRLKEIGHEVTIVSSGGIYVNDLDKLNITHVHAPLTKKDPLSIINSYKTIKKLSIDKSIDIIHAHGRIPSLVGELVSKKLNIPMVTTVHALYKSSIIYNFLSYYGKKTICISKDTKDLAINTYSVKEEQITVIPNGIEFDTFDIKKLDTREIDDLKMSKDSFKVSYISRMSGELSNRAFIVAKALNSFSEQRKEYIDLLLVGDGDDFEELKAKLAILNKNEYMTIHLLGKRRDIPQILNNVDISLCVSRTALESMACKKPVILIGGEGFEGVLNKNNYLKLEKDNFTARKDSKLFTEESFIDAFKSLYGDEHKTNRNELGNWLYTQIASNYDIKNVVAKTISVYHDAMEEN